MCHFASAACTQRRCLNVEIVFLLCLCMAGKSSSSTGATSRATCINCIAGTVDSTIIRISSRVVVTLAPLSACWDSALLRPLSSAMCHFASELWLIGVGLGVVFSLSTPRCVASLLTLVSPRPLRGLHWCCFVLRVLPRRHHIMSQPPHMHPLLALEDDALT